MKDNSGELVINDSQKAEVLNKQFQSVFTVDNGKSLQTDSHPINQTMKDFEITTAGILSATVKLSNKVSRTPDNIPTYFLKFVTYPLLPILTYLFNLSVNKPTVPTVWKSAIITPIYKKGSRDLPTGRSL